jgi:hypothetical protein
VLFFGGSRSGLPAVFCWLSGLCLCMLWFCERIRGCGASPSHYDFDRTAN